MYNSLLHFSLSEYMASKRQELQEQLQRIEQRCFRMQGPGAKENKPDSHKDVQDLNKKGLFLLVLKTKNDSSLRSNSWN